MYKLVHNGFDVRKLEKDDIDKYIESVVSRSFTPVSKIMDEEVGQDKIRLVRYRYDDTIGMEEIFIIEKIEEWE